jgi:hypothetical protein
MEPILFLIITSLLVVEAGGLVDRQMPHCRWVLAAVLGAGALATTMSPEHIMVVMGLLVRVILVVLEVRRPLYMAAVVAGALV